MIRIDETYAIVTQESAEAGDVSDAGFIRQNELVTFRELVDLLRDGGFSEPSESPCDCPRWVSDNGRQNAQTWAYETRSIHVGSDARSLRWWPRALRAAGIKTGRD